MAITLRNPMYFELGNNNSIEVDGISYNVKYSKAKGDNVNVSLENDNELSVAFGTIPLRDYRDVSALSKHSALRWCIYAGLIECDLFNRDEIIREYGFVMDGYDKAEIEAINSITKAYYDVKNQFEFMWRRRKKDCIMTELNEEYWVYTHDLDEPEFCDIKQIGEENMHPLYREMACYFGSKYLDSLISAKIGRLYLGDFIIMPGFEEKIESSPNDVAGFIDTCFTEHSFYNKYVALIEVLKDKYEQLENIKKERKHFFRTHILGECDLD